MDFIRDLSNLLNQRDQLCERPPRIATLYATEKSLAFFLAAPYSSVNIDHDQQRIPQEPEPISVNCFQRSSSKRPQWEPV